MVYKSIILEKEAVVSTIVLNRPTLLDALNKNIFAEIYNSLKDSRTLKGPFVPLKGLLV